MSSRDCSTATLLSRCRSDPPPIGAARGRTVPIRRPGVSAGGESHYVSSPSARRHRPRLL